MKFHAFSRTAAFSLVSFLCGIALTYVFIRNRGIDEYAILSKVYNNPIQIEERDIIEFLISEPDVENEIFGQLYKVATADAMKLLIKKHPPTSITKGELIDSPYYFSQTDLNDGGIVFETVLDQNPEVVSRAADAVDSYYRRWKITYNHLERPINQKSSKGDKL